MILALETSSSLGSLAIGEPGRLVETREFAGARHSAALFSSLRELTLPSLRIETVIVGVGPGSFSSIRASIAAAQAIAFAKGSRLRSVCSACSLALQFCDVARLGVFSDARRGELYGTLFSFGRLVRSTFVFPKEELAIRVQSLDLAIASEELGPGLHRAFPRAEDFLRIEEESPAFSEEPFPEPLYFRSPLAAPAGSPS
ncbi:tRNA (adenosine(37)-N6)-threonylcarbamoyltransferase complex dimerization subunit type 1 TsaB [Methylacidimicrobium sp. B4]|uniref:tRNA (adenosine(37)-N6)-threonylcarbamoyltransferase complex dimerization subunit type 1 TsaB n=1 Tax=Methylacidimicrobium sp. B4 TaxID=2796139 RepID=UPI001A901F6F|nr:tRNA (adenosine(37)-N6)-threonylcarbamoyltransferase complex dimerization subunit type 1 TsaB [Methylacidimicrobium sp. B4]QSR84129.1 tRNA (adenosine(37)-N6)-threonylcarbamoyltransferase complex dimerization subunit type 1 TsaB [Methylacidimicrobium sp. B4]